MTDSSRSEVTRILLDLSRAPDERAAARLFEVVYEELRVVAGGLLRGERAGHTLRPTALVHEAYLRLVDVTGLSPENRAHFFGIAARAMRQVLVDHARRRAAAKRGGGQERITLTDGVAGEEDRAFELLELEEALVRYAEVDPRAARGVELRVFGGLTGAEVAGVLGVSRRTADGDWAMARMWLTRELTGRES